jgi:DNA-directed RNA polymerase subunit RPC12/RpoP
VALEGQILAEKAMVFRKGVVQRILKAVKSGELNFLEPTVNYDFGVEYPKLKELGLGRDEALSILNDLCEVGILVGEVVYTLAICPYCRSHRLFLQLRCPTCGSTRLSKGAVIEHLLCGHVDVEDNFRMGEDLVCQKCRKPLKAIGVDYRKPGVLFKCLDCQAPFPHPKAMYTCSDGHMFDESELAVFQVRAYRPNPAGRVLLEKATIDLEPVLGVLANRGWHVEIPSVIRGKAGVDHEFSFAVWKDKSDRDSKPPNVVGELVISEGRANSTVVLAFWAKSIDVEAKDKIVMAVPGLDEKAEMLAKSYDMHVMEAENGSELQAKAESMLRNMLQGVDTLISGAKTQEKPLIKPVGHDET